jgi:NitT/TauT family transport system substrate-binding protein
VSKRWSSTLGVLIAVGMLTAGCGDDDDDGGGATGGDTEGEAGAEDTSDGGDLTPITVGILPIADLAPLYHGIDAGYFEEEGLEVTTEVGQGGAALVPSVVNGDYQVAFGNYVSLMLARQNDVEVQILANVVNGADTEDRGTNALLVAPDSGITSVDDLAGRTFAVTTLQNVAEVNIRTPLREADVDDDDIEFVELPFPEMNAAVESGDVDVAWQAEPFVTLGEQAGLVNIVDPMYATMPSMPLAGMFASTAWIEENPDLAEAFQRAMQRSIEDSADEEAMRAAIEANTETPPEILPDLALANWVAELDADKLQTIATLATDYGLLEEEPDLDQLIWPGG